MESFIFIRDFFWLGIPKYRLKKIWRMKKNQVLSLQLMEHIFFLNSFGLCEGRIIKTIVYKDFTSSLKKGWNFQDYLQPPLLDQFNVM